MRRQEPVRNLHSNHQQFRNRRDGRHLMNKPSTLTSSSPIQVGKRSSMAIYALTIGAFGIGTTEFVIMGLLLQLAADMHVSVPTAGLLISGYALGVFVGAPVLTA